MLPQDDRAAPPACAQGTPTPNDHIVQRAHGLNQANKAMIGAKGAEKVRFKSQKRVMEQKLYEACDHAMRKAQP